MGKRGITPNWISENDWSAKRRLDRRKYMEQEKIYQITRLIAVNLLAWTWLNQQDPQVEYIPPTEEQAIREYQNSPMFHRMVDSMVSGIINIASQPDVEADAPGWCRCGSSATFAKDGLCMVCGGTKRTA
jgi:hypothetical protein